MHVCAWIWLYSPVIYSISRPSPVFSPTMSSMCSRATVLYRASHHQNACGQPSNPACVFYSTCNRIELNPRITLTVMAVSKFHEFIKNIRLHSGMHSAGNYVRSNLGT